MRARTSACTIAAISPLGIAPALGTRATTPMSPAASLWSTHPAVAGGRGLHRGTGRIGGQGEGEDRAGEHHGRHGEDGAE